MVENMGEWPSERGPISEIESSDGCGRDGVPVAADHWSDFHEFGCHLGNAGLNDERHRKRPIQEKGLTQDSERP